MPPLPQRPKRTCQQCATVPEQTPRRRTPIDVIGASVLGLLILGIALLFADVFGLGGGRYGGLAIIGVPGLIVWGLRHMVDVGEAPPPSCPSHDSQAPNSRVP